MLMNDEQKKKKKKNEVQLERVGFNHMVFFFFFSWGRDQYVIGVDVKQSDGCLLVLRTGARNIYIYIYI